MYKTNILKVSRQVKWKVQVLAQNADTYCNNCKIFAETLKIVYKSQLTVYVWQKFIQNSRYHVGVFNVYNQGVTLLASSRQLSQVIYCSSQARQAQLFTQPPPYIQKLLPSSAKQILKEAQWDKITLTIFGDCNNSGPKYKLTRSLSKSKLLKNVCCLCPAIAVAFLHPLEG